MNPLEIFADWLRQETEISPVAIPTACCLSTIGLDGYPNARYVSFKELIEDCFVITGPLNSRKGREMEKVPKASLTFWWPHIEKQVRVQGDVVRLSASQADQFFGERNQQSKIVSVISRQGEPLEDFNKLKDALNSFNHQNIKRPGTWGGFRIKPLRIELLEFDESRLHFRRVFSKTDDGWNMTVVHP